MLERDRGIQASRGWEKGGRAMNWAKGCAYGSLALSGLCLVLAIVAKVGMGEVAGLSSRALYAVALILGVYSAAFSMCGAGSKTR
jgi:hypothetical protein